MTQEAQNALAQAKEVAKLTKLAFFFIPLSFTASLFGMNVMELDPGAANSIWLWVTVSIPVLAISFTFMLVDIRKVGEWLCDVPAKWRKKPPRRQEVEMT